MGTSISASASNNCIDNFDYKYGTVDSLRNLDSLVENWKSKCHNFWLFAHEDSGSSENGGGKSHSKLGLSNGKLVSVAHDIVTASIKSKLVWPQSQLKFSHANKKNLILGLPIFSIVSSRGNLMFTTNKYV